MDPTDAIVGDRGQRVVIDVAADEIKSVTGGSETVADGGEESAVTACGVEHDDVPTEPTLAPGEDTVDDHVDEFRRRVPGTALLAGVAAFGHRDMLTRPPVGRWYYLVAVPDRYLTFDRDEWAILRAATPLTLRQHDLDSLRGINERIDLDEVVAIYLPLSRLLNLYVSAVQDLQRVSATFLGSMSPRVPYVIGVAGSVAVGKSTFARILQALLSRWPNHPQVDLVTTDGFLHPNSVLAERGLMDRKGFPESYDTRALLAFLRAVKSGEPEVSAPVYDHVTYDILPGESVLVRRPDIVIVEGLNVLQVDREGAEFVSDYFDFSIYVDADVADIEQWYIQRFFALRESVFKDPDSYFQNFAGLTDEEATATARHIWASINGRNLRENIEPTRDRASLIIRKERDHRVSRVSLRKL